MPSCIHSPKWQARYLKLASDISYWSNDTSTKVGAVIANDRKRTIGLGVNGFPEDIEDRAEWLEDRETRLENSIHAEVNAILNAEKPTRGCAIYVTHSPCAECAKFLIAAGIREIHYLEPPAEFAERWASSLSASQRLCIRAGVRLVGHKL